MTTDTSSMESVMSEARRRRARWVIIGEVDKEENGSDVWYFVPETNQLHLDLGQEFDLELHRFLLALSCAPDFHVDLILKVGR